MFQILTVVISVAVCILSILPALPAGVVVECRRIRSRDNATRQVVTGVGERPALPAGSITVRDLARR
jgi:hypothetical protein